MPWYSWVGAVLMLGPPAVVLVVVFTQFIKDALEQRSWGDLATLGMIALMLVGVALVAAGGIAEGGV